MDLFGILEMIGGLSLFLFGMSVMGTGLEKTAGNKLKSLLERLTSSKLNGFLLGLGVTAVIQSSSATTVMAVGFVNSGLMTLKQAIHVIMGANVGTTVTAWILSLTQIKGSNVFVMMLKPSSFTPILALIGVVYYLFIKSEKKKDIGMIMLGFATLIYGMEIMSAAIEPLGQVEGFRKILLMFTNPVLGVLAGAVFTGIIQSSSASVGILQALSATGQVTIGASIPIIMGQNIGTTVTSLISSVGTNKNARRTALVHLYFNVIGTIVFLFVFSMLRLIIDFPFLDQTANRFIIALIHSVFNILCTAMLLPLSGLLEKLAYKTIRESDEEDKVSLLDSRLYSTPAIAVERGRMVALEMAKLSITSIKQALEAVYNYNEGRAQAVKDMEKQTDKYEDAIGTYLVNLSTYNLSVQDNTEAAKLLYLIGEFERITDYSVSIVASAQEIEDKKLSFSESAKYELDVLISAVEESVEIAIAAFNDNDLSLAAKVEPLEEVIDRLKSELKKRHITRMQRNECTIEMGFVFSDLITVLERVSDHCSNIASAIIEMSHDRMDMHSYQHRIKHEPNDGFSRQFEKYTKKYSL
ncbi:MAG: Na/Pi cotransporter family protein [Clostridiales bacterium]|nr:Na/Pi cotransporter family protein [Clostridiales bacterium]